MVSLLANRQSTSMCPDVLSVGSGNATHSAFFDLDPEYFIMSVGEDYGHPSMLSCSISMTKKLKYHRLVIAIFYDSILRPSRTVGFKSTDSFNTLSILATLQRSSRCC